MDQYIVKDLTKLTDTPALMASSRALVLSPNVSRFWTDGPTKVMSLSAQAWANSADSDRTAL